jgi:CHAD domain-containing protein
MISEHFRAPPKHSAAAPRSGGKSSHAFQLKAGESARRGVRRVMRRQLKRALGELDRAGQGDDDAIHELRKQIKKLRSILRLVRDELEAKNYKRANSSFREAARSLNDVRDSLVLVESLEKLSNAHNDGLSVSSTQSLSQLLNDRKGATLRDLRNSPKTIRTVKRRLKDGEKRVRKRNLGCKDWRKLASGIVRAYDSGRRAMRAALRQPTTEHLHECRKQAKCLWHQLQFLEGVWPAGMETIGASAQRLADLLGDDHDLAMLSQAAAADAPDCGTRETALLVSILSRHRADMQQEALDLGRVLYRSKPETIRQFVKSNHWHPGIPGGARFA